MTRDEIVAAARAWKGIPWRKSGRSETGVDCIGLVVMVAKSFGLDPQDQPNYSTVPDGERLQAMIAAQTTKAHYPAQGTIGLFHCKGLPFHAGIFAEKYGKLSLIHAFAKRRKVVEDIYDPKTFSAELYGLYDFPGVE